MFHLDLLKENNEIVTIDIIPADTSLGVKWAQALKEEIDKGVVIPQDDRIYNLNDKWTPKDIVSEINKRIDIINEYDNFIDFTLTHPMTQDDSNKLHHYFELMRGENDEPNEYYNNSPRHIKTAIEDFNVLIHRWEDHGSPGRIVVHIQDRPMYDLSVEDYDAWTLKYKPGDVCINYCHKGKPILDIFKDGDNVISDDNIRPQTRYSADFNLGFNYGFGFNPVRLKQINEWLDQNNQMLTNLGFPKGSPLQALGKGVVGHIAGSAFLVKAKCMNAVKILNVRYS